MNLLICMLFFISLRNGRYRCETLSTVQ